MCLRQNSNNWDAIAFATHARRNLKFAERLPHRGKSHWNREQSKDFCVQSLVNNGNAQSLAQESLELIFASRGQKNEERTFDSSYAASEYKKRRGRRRRKSNSKIKGNQAVRFIISAKQLANECLTLGLRERESEKKPPKARLDSGSKCSCSRLALRI